MSEETPTLEFELPQEVRFIDDALQELHFAQKEPSTAQRKRHIMRSAVKLMHAAVGDTLMRTRAWVMKSDAENRVRMLRNIAMMAAWREGCDMATQRYHAMFTLENAFQSPGDDARLHNALHEVLLLREMVLQK